MYSHTTSVYYPSIFSHFTKLMFNCYNFEHYDNILTLTYWGLIIYFHKLFQSCENFIEVIVKPTK